MEMSISKKTGQKQKPIGTLLSWTFKRYDYVSKITTTIGVIFKNFKDEFHFIKIIFYNKEVILRLILKK